MTAVMPKHEPMLRTEAVWRSSRSRDDQLCAHAHLFSAAFGIRVVTAFALCFLGLFLGLLLGLLLDLFLHFVISLQVFVLRASEGSSKPHNQSGTSLALGLLLDLLCLFLELLGLLLHALQLLLVFLQFLLPLLAAQKPWELAQKHQRFKPKHAI